MSLSIFILSKGLSSHKNFCKNFIRVLSLLLSFHVFSYPYLQSSKTCLSIVHRLFSMWNLMVILIAWVCTSFSWKYAHLPISYIPIFLKKKRRAGKGTGSSSSSSTSTLHSIPLLTRESFTCLCFPNEICIKIKCSINTTNNSL